MCVKIQFCTNHRLWDVIFSLKKSKSLSTTGQALCHLYILSPVISPLTHMYSVEPSLRRLNCTEVETRQPRKAPSPRCIIPFNSFIHGTYLLYVYTQTRLICSALRRFSLLQRPDASFHYREALKLKLGRPVFFIYGVILKICQNTKIGF